MSSYGDSFWDQWLPRNYNDIVAKAASPLIYSSKGDLWYTLWWGIFLEGGTQRLWMDRSTYKKVVIMVSAKALDINGGLDSRCWQWVSREDSRFGQAAEAKDVEWFEVWQRIDCTLLTPLTRYRVSFVLKIDRYKVANCASPFIFSLKTASEAEKQSFKYLDNFNKPISNGDPAPVRGDENGWLEFVVGDFNSQGTSWIEVYMKNVDRSFRKKGIFIDGVKLTPIG